MDYLAKNGSEVLNMLFQEWDMDTALEVRYEEGIEKGIEKGISETARRMLAGGLKPEQIAEFTGFSLEKIKSLKPETGAKPRQ